MSNYHIKHLEEYYQVYRKSITEPENFWEEVAEEHFSWYKKWNKVLSWDFIKPEIKWFEGAKLNITENTLKKERRVIDLKILDLSIKKSINTYAKIKTGNSL